MSNYPIAIFDSGVGGLSVYQHIKHALPNENLLYLADSTYAPYGDKSTSELLERILHISDFLLAQQVKALVVACNTATAVAIKEIRNKYVIPIVGLEPAIKPAVQSQSGLIGVLATANTLQSEKYLVLKKQHASQTEIIDCACHGWVEFIESGEEDSAEFYQAMTRSLQDLQNKHVDTLVLGCTHYPFVKNQIQKIMGYDINIIDSGKAISKHLAYLLNEFDIDNKEAGEQYERFLTTQSDNVEAEMKKFSRLLKRPVKVEAVEI